ncbi:MAG TPA: hypothetical protein VL284_18570 [Thermoanaerobaculia bacterium]|nr:hypothetical protein [Thermoanaerobaculia bacterium]
MLTLIIMAALNTQQLADKVVQAYGGAAAWAKVASIRQTGRVIPAMRPGDGKLTREWQRPDKLRVEIAYPSHTEVRVVDGDHGTQNGKEATGMGLDAMRLQAARIALPLLIEEHRGALRSAGANSIDVPLGGGMSVTVDVDPSTGHILKSTGRAEGIEFSTSYSNFQTIDGLLFASTEVNTAMGTTTATNELSKIEVTRAK